MRAGFIAEFCLTSEDETAAFGCCIAPLLLAGDTILLQGPIGAGKTHLARALIQARLAAAGIMEDVPSPTYTLMQTYFDGSVEILHADLYRLTDPQEIIELGLDEAFLSHIALVEWPDRLGDNTPVDALTLTLIPVGDARRLTLSSRSEKWSKLACCLGKVT
jgi:tRNA threonylcarbamoyladenosine biosynthesis protein TsaE